MKVFFHYVHLQNIGRIAQKSIIPRKIVSTCDFTHFVKNESKKKIQIE